MRARLKEQFRTGRVVHAIVKIPSARSLRLFHARVSAAKVSDPRRPHLLAADRRKQVLRCDTTEPPPLFALPRQKIKQVLSNCEVVPGCRIDAVEVLVLLCQYPRWCAIKLHADLL